MASFWCRKVSQKGSFPPPPASQGADLGMHMKENGPKPWVEDALPQQPVVGDPGRKFAKFYRCLWSKAQLKGGRKQQQASQGAEKSWRATGMQEQAANRCAKMEGKVQGLQGPKTCQKATRDGDTQKEEQLDLVNIHSMGLHFREDGQDEPITGHKAWDGDLPRGRGVHGDEVVQAGASKDEKERTTGLPQSLGLWMKDKDAATILQGDWQDCNPQSVEGRPGEEQRRQVWEKLQLLGEDMAEWEGRSTKDLSVRLMNVILQRDTKDYPMVMGRGGEHQQQGVGRVRVGGSEQVHALVVTTVQQDLAADHDIPTLGGFMCENSQHVPTMPEPFGDEQFWEDSDDDLLEQGDPADVPVLVHYIRMMRAKNEEHWQEEFPDVWVRYEMECGLVSEEVEVKVKLVDFQPQPQLAVAMENKVAGILKVLLRDGVVVKGHSPYNIPLDPQYKDGGRKFRLKLDCRAINKATPKVMEPVRLNTTELISTVSPKSKYFSVVDLSNASFAIPLAAGSRASFPFTFQNQQYFFTRLPQGFHSTTSIIHQRVAQMLSQLDQGDRPWVFFYIDDILITGQSQRETEGRTRRVLELIRKTGFKAKFNKAQLVLPKVVYLGRKIGHEGREIQDEMLEMIRKTPRPRNVSGVRSLLGRIVWVQDHIPNYWELALPLHRLTLKQARWEWGPEQQTALQRLKHAVETAPALRFPDKSQPFVIKLTTSKEVVGAALLQENEEGQLVPVRYSSCKLKDHEVMYKPKEKGCLAAVWALQEFETLTGSAPILIQMPHSPWKYLLRGDVLGSNGTNLHQTRWTLLLVNGGEVARGPQPEWEGFLVPSAPPLCQLPSFIPKANVWFTASEKGRSVGFAAANLEERWLLGVAECDSVLDAELVALWQLLCHHRCSSPLYLYTGCESLVKRLEGWWERGPGVSSGGGLWPSILQWVRTNPGMLHIRCVGVDMSKDIAEMEWNQEVVRRASAMSHRATGSQQFWEPSKHEKQEIIVQCHSWQHEEVEETLARVRQIVSWEGDREQVTYWVQNCLDCAAPGVLPQRTEGPWSQLQLGYVSDLIESEEGYCSLLVVEDGFSGWVEAFPIGKNMVDEMVEVLLREVFAQYGTPSVIHLPDISPFLRDVAMMAVSRMESPWGILQTGQVGPATSALQQLAQRAGKRWVKVPPVIVAGVRSVWARGEALGSCQMIGGFPLEMRWGWEAEDGPEGNVLSWLRQLQEDVVLYKRQIEAMLPRGCPGEEAPWP